MAPASQEPQEMGNQQGTGARFSQALTRICPTGSELSRVGEGGCPCRSVQPRQAVAQWTAVGGRGG